MSIRILTFILSFFVFVWSGIELKPFLSVPNGAILL